MKILILGGDGYLGWPTAMYLSNKGHDVAVVDSFHRRLWDQEIGADSLIPIAPLHDRVRVWNELGRGRIEMYIGDITEWDFLEHVWKDFDPESIVHYAEHRAAPFSMLSRRHAVETQVNNVVGTLNILYAMKDLTPEAHLVNLGTMGEYGTPNPPGSIEPLTRSMRSAVSRRSAPTRASRFVTPGAMPIPTSAGTPADRKRSSSSSWRSVVW